MPAFLHETHNVATHPHYVEMSPVWDLMRMSFSGARAVKSAGTKYLPPTDGMALKGMGSATAIGQIMYRNYLNRAKFPEFIKESVPKLVGLLNEGETVFELPPRLEPMRRHATVKGESLANLIRSIHEQVLIAGRIGLLGDIPSNGGPSATPMIATYEAEAIKNWNDEPTASDQQRSLKWVVLDESGYRQNSDISFEWTSEARTRILALGDPDRPLGDLPAGQYGTALMVGDQFAEVPSEFVVPSIANKALDRIPFVFINRNDLVARPDSPPLEALANHGMLVYLAEADYRWALHMQAQETLVITGAEQPTDVPDLPTGAGAVVWLSDPASAAKYVGVSSEGLEEARQALENDYAFAGELGAQIIDTGGNAREAADTLRIRQSTRSTNLLSIANTSAEGLEQCLKHLAVWVGADPDRVKVIANTDFVEQEEFAGDDIKKIMEAMVLGAPLSKRSLHKRLQEHDMTELTYEEELAAIEAEKEEFSDLLMAPEPTPTEGGTPDGQQESEQMQRTSEQESGDQAGDEDVDRAA